MAKLPLHELLPSALVRGDWRPSDVTEMYNFHSFIS